MLEVTPKRVAVGYYVPIAVSNRYYAERNVGSASFKDLVVWQRAVELTLEIYRLTGTFPSSEQFGLTSQMRRASVSIASNIAEGTGRASKGEYLQFLGHAKGSICELQTQLVIAERLGFGSNGAYVPIISLSADVSRLLLGLIASLKR